jgi:hypothetical protein
MALEGATAGSKYIPKPRVAGQEDPMAILAAIMAQGGSAQYSGPPADNTDYFAAASQVYDPQMDYLSDLEKKTKAQAAASGKSIDQVYAALAASIGGQASGIKSSYNDALSQSGAAYNQAYNQSKGSFDSARNGVAETLARLGINEAGANTVGKQSEMQQLMQGIISANSLAQKNALTSGRQSSLDYNTAMQSGAKLRGADARAALTSQLNDFLNQLGMKRADLKSTINQTAMSMQSDASKSAYDQWRDQQQMNLEREKMGIDAAQFGAKMMADSASKSASSTGDLSKMDPVGAINTLASQMYGNSQAAGNAVKAVMDTVRYGGNDMSLPAFLDLLENRNRGANDLGNLRRLGVELYRRMFK